MISIGIKNADGITFGANGNVAIGMTGGLDYNGAAGIGSTTDKGGSLQASLSSLSSGYDLFANKEAVSYTHLTLPTIYSV